MTDLGLWRLDKGKATRIAPTAIAQERPLESYIESEPSMLGDLLLIGRQVPTSRGRQIDLLAIDEAGAVHMIEVKAGAARRDIIGQVLGYGEWAATLGRAELINIFADYRADATLEEAFYNRFQRKLPEEVGPTPVLSIFVASVEAETESILQKLRNHGVPIDVILFQHFHGEETSYLATWLVVHDEPPAAADASALKTTAGVPLKSDRPASLKGFSELSAARDRIDQQLRSSIDELRTDPQAPHSWETVADAIGVPSASAATRVSPPAQEASTELPEIRRGDDEYRAVTTADLAGQFIMGEQVSVLEARSDAACTASDIAAVLASGSVYCDHWAFRRFIVFNEVLAAEEGAARLSLTLGEPASTGSTQWDAAIAAVCEYRLNADSLPIPSWVMTRKGNSSAFWVPPESRYNTPADPSKVPEEFLRRGILIHASSLRSS